MATILIIDDDPDIRAIVRMCLVQLGDHVVLEARGATEGVRRCIEHRPDAVLLDLMMPDIDGLGCLEQLRAASGAHGWRLPPVFLMTARSDSGVGAVEGLRGVISKPFDPVELLGELRKVVSS
jgi:CheY-like chemotaxis protein